MFHKLKRRLILLYGVTSSVILTTIVTGAFIINNKQRQDQKRVLFEKNVEQIVEIIRGANVISSSWLAKMQAEQQLYIYIEDNGKELSYFLRQTGTTVPNTLIENLKTLALEDDIPLNRKPYDNSVKKTSTYTISQNSQNSYLGMATLIPYENTWRNVMIFYYDKNQFNNFIRQIFLFASIDFVGIAAFFLLSSLYINKILKPLSEGQKRQTAFIAAASHELRSPLTVIKTGISTIREDDSKTVQILPHIEGECNRMNRLISDMLFLASSDAKTWNLLLEPVDMDTLLIESYDMFCNICNRNQNEVTLDLPEVALHTINGDKERLKQILSVLVDNAMSHTPAGTIIFLRAYNQKNHVVIEVEDHGGGIDDFSKKTVFERFYKGDQSRNDKTHFGLGLSIAKELIELHKGDISIKDTVGGGATFVIRLPVSFTIK